MVSSIRPVTTPHASARKYGSRAMSMSLPPTFHVADRSNAPQPGTNSKEESVYWPGSPTLTGHETVRFVTPARFGKALLVNPVRLTTIAGVVWVNTMLVVTSTPLTVTTTSLDASR